MAINDPAKSIYVCVKGGASSTLMLGRSGVTLNLNVFPSNLLHVVMTNRLYRIPLLQFGETHSSCCAHQNRNTKWGYLLLHWFAINLYPQSTSSRSDYVDAISLADYKSK